jgi:hypothetical protein
MFDKPLSAIQQARSWRDEDINSSELTVMMLAAYELKLDHQNLYADLDHLSAQAAQQAISGYKKDCVAAEKVGVCVGGGVYAFFYVLMCRLSGVWSQGEH